jgi:hypothetical protein
LNLGKENQRAWSIFVESGLVPLQEVLVENEHFTKNGKKKDGEIDTGTSLVAILGDCANLKILKRLQRTMMQLFSSRPNIAV